MIKINYLQKKLNYNKYFKMENYINENTIIKDELYNAFKESVTCPLCLSILISPVMCMKCQNVFCKRCINDWTKKDQKCPNRCTEPNYQRSIGKNEILSKLKFKCEACGNNYKYDEAQKHLNSCYPEQIKEDENKIENNENKTENNENKVTTNEPKFEKISRDEIERLKRQGNDVTYITSK